MRIWSDEAQPKVFWLVLLMALAAALLIAAPGQTVVVKYVNDLFIFLDGAHRIDAGQVPNRDFHTALGPLNFYLPAIGLWLSGSLGAAMPWGVAGLLLALAPAIAHVLATRMRPVIALPFAAFVILVFTLPAHLGEGITDLAFGMFYNRIGWVTLGALLVMQLRPSHVRRQQILLDGFAAALFTLVLVYTKASYGAVAVAFLVLVAVSDPKQRPWAVVALAVTIGVGLFVEAFWRASAAHVADLVLAGRVSGAIKDWQEFATHFLRNLADFVLYGLLVGLALWRTRRLRDLLFYAFCAGAGLAIIGQNYQNWGVLTLHAGAAVAAETLARSERLQPAIPSWSVQAGAPFLLLALLLPTIVHAGAALGLHATLATARAGESFGLPRLADARFAPVWYPWDHANNARYLVTLRDGAKVLEEFEPKASHVFVLDFVNPFSSALGLAPPRGDTAWNHWGRNLDERNFLPAEEILRDVRIVMEPKEAIEGVTGDNLRRAYGPYLDRMFELVRETPGWRVYLSREWRPETSPRPAGEAGGNPARISDDLRNRSGRAVE